MSKQVVDYRVTQPGTNRISTQVITPPEAYSYQLAVPARIPFPTTSVNQPEQAITISRPQSPQSSYSFLNADENVTRSENLHEHDDLALEQTHKRITVLDIARYFLCRVDREAGDTISPLKLQKLVYYAQAWSLALRDELLFSEPIEAWVHGPVVYELWNAYKNYKYGAIPAPLEPLLEFSEDILEVLDEVWETYGELSARKLEQLTHSELPWLNARKGLGTGDKSRNIISCEDMKSYYSSLIVGDGKQKEAT